MNKRLRKKLHKGEFAQYGFDVVVDLAVDTIPTVDDVDGFVDNFIEPFCEFLEGMGLGCGGGGGQAGRFEFFVAARKGSANEAHQQAVSTWLSGQKSVKAFEVKKLVDAWYGW